MLWLRTLFLFMRTGTQRKNAGRAGGRPARKQGRCMFGKKNGKGWEDGTVVYCGEEGGF